jgi:glutathione S-transferase
LNWHFLCCAFRKVLPPPSCPVFLLNSFSSMFVSTHRTSIRNFRLLSLPVHHFSSLSNHGKLTIYGAKYSQPSRAVILLCEHAKIPYTLVEVDPMKGEARTPEYRKINPAGLVPAIKVERENNVVFTLAEAPAILQYLCNVHQLENYYPSKDLRHRAQVDYWLSWHHLNTRVCTTQVLLPLLFRKMCKDEKKLESTVSSGLKSMHKALAFLESHLTEVKKKSNMTSSSASLFITSSNYYTPPPPSSSLSSAFNHHVTIADLLLHGVVRTCYSRSRKRKLLSYT